MDKRVPALTLENSLFILVSFEGPDRYAQAGGLAVRVTGLAEALARLGYETHLVFLGDPALPGEEHRLGPAAHPPSLGAVGERISSGRARPFFFQMARWEREKGWDAARAAYRTARLFTWESVVGLLLARLQLTLAGALR